MTDHRVKKGCFTTIHVTVFMAFCNSTIWRLSPLVFAT